MDVEKCRQWDRLSFQVVNCEEKGAIGWWLRAGQLWEELYLDGSYSSLSKTKANKVLKM